MAGEKIEKGSALCDDFFLKVVVSKEIFELGGRLLVRREGDTSANVLEDWLI